MDTVDKKKHPEGCMCGVCESGVNAPMCHCGYSGHRGHWGWIALRVIVILFLLGVVFCLGVVTGEFRALVGGGFHAMHARYGSTGQMMHAPLRMMDGVAAPTSTGQ